MIASDFKDADGFRLQFEDTVTDDERVFYMRTFIRVDDVAKDRVHCTTCDVHVGTAPISEKIIRTHQILGVTQCNKCFAFYNSGEFGKGEDGSEYYCRWCGQGGEVFCCSTCPFVFCNKCIKDNLTMAYIKEIERNDDWSCFVCNRETLKRLRAQHWALRNFMNKQLEKIQNVNINSEEELNTMLNDDQAICCPKKKRKQILKPAPAPVKRPATNGGGLTLTGPPAKKQIIAPTKMLKVPVNTNYHLTKPGPKPTPPASMAKPKGNNEVVCTPDILGLFNNKTQGPPQRPQTSTAPPPLIMRQNQRPVRPMGSTSGTAGNPIYHTVNGYQIDLNQAARQEIFRLPNGKLIQVRKQPNSSPAAPTIRPGLHFAMQPRAHIPVRPSPPTITTTSRMMRPAMAPQLRVARPQVPQQRQAAPSQSNTPGTVASTVFTQQNGSISVARAPQPDTQFGKAKTAFEDKIINGLEICQHTINKMITLTNSSSFKNSRSFADLKDLYIHLQYLFTYTSGKIKTLQDSLGTNVEELAKHDKSLKEKEKHDSDELEIVEQKQDVIEVLSDDDEPPARSNQVATKKTAAPMNKSPEQQALDIEQEILSALVATMQDTFARQPDQPELLASCNYMSDDKKLLTKSAVKVERLEDSKSPLVKQYMIAIQQRRDREPSVEQSADNEEAEDGEDDFPPLVPEIVMDENPNPEETESEVAEENKESGDAEPEANEEEKMETEEAPKSTNETADVVEIPSDDDEATNENETADKENDQSKEEGSQDVEENNEEQSKNDVEVPEQSMDVDNNESTEDNPDESVISLDSSLTCNEATENGTAEENEAPEDVADNGNDVDMTENGENRTETENENTNQADEGTESIISKDAESNPEEITKITENGIDEKDLLDNLINSLDENEPLAPIELENFP
ncbi:FK506-binding protein 5 isoform X2 [Chironomus tepperi]|uniref:FK506-binding protein 5 isoform X2 n=1 Tax=Chironomus tepperi TaxID=113505 RepID=UPI00391F34CB